MRSRLRSWRVPLELFCLSRAMIWVAVLFAYLVFEPNRGPAARGVDIPRLTHDLGYATDVWARWDSIFFLHVAERGYGIGGGVAAAFFPLYPAAVGGVGRLLSGHYIAAGIAVSLLATVAAYVLLYELARARLGEDGARRAVLYLSLFPMSFFLQAVYSESLYLSLALAAFLLAERGLFLEASAAAGLATLTRPVGFALVPALAVLAWRSRSRAGSLASLVLAPLMFALYPLALWREVGDPFAFTHAERFWRRHVSPAGPLGGAWDGARLAWRGLRQVASVHSAEIVSGPNPMRIAAQNVEYFAFLVLFVGLTVVAWRSFGAPYGLFAALSIAIPLAAPAEDAPLLSLPRFGLVVFPFFLALARLGERPRVHTGIALVSGVLLGVSLVQWTLWQFVS